jgi:tetratricopeptide (TPR) repeat protein
MERHAPHNYLPGILVISLFGVYLSTMCPTVYLGDSGELTTAAYCLGIPHNSGYPLYALLGKLFCFIPFCNIAFRLNLMSTVFAVLTLWLVYSLVLKITSSQVSALVGSLLLAFTPVFWSQAVCAEVYSLHVFFAALLISLLWWWNEKRTFCRLACFVFVTGISFGNHMQTVMLAPAALFLVLSGDYKALWNLKNFVFLSLCFFIALSLYAYLPIRTEAGAAIHWGDPDSLGRFLAHVTGRSHRQGYVLTKDLLGYLIRTKEILWFVGSQFGWALPLALWGWLRLPETRWKIFFLAVILFDLIYGVFLNIISLEVTPFGLPSCLTLAILIGLGTAQLLRTVKESAFVGSLTGKVIHVAVLLIPAVPLSFNYGLCDQSSNYTAYEHALNIFRTVDTGATLLLDGDNNILPVMYGRIVERMREDVTLYDRPNLFFKMPYVDEYRDGPFATWDELRPIVEQRIMKEAQEGLYYAVFNPSAVSVQDEHAIHPWGILYRITERETPLPQDVGRSVWPLYITESVIDDFRKDFMNREVAAYFHFARGKYHLMASHRNEGLESMELASRVGYDHPAIHSDMAVFLTDHSFFEQARLELEKALIYYEDLSGVYNNWGYYYHKLGDYDEAAVWYAKAIELCPDNQGYYNNLGLALYHGGRKSEARIAFQKSLDVAPDQPKLKRFLKSDKITSTRYHHDG